MKTIEMLEEMKRLPWRKDILKSLTQQLKERGKLTPKQQSFITDMYIDNCIISDEEINRQVKLRKLCFRLQECRLGRVQSFVNSVITFTENRPFSLAQGRSIINIAHRKRKELQTIEEYTEKNFDGWRLK